MQGMRQPVEMKQDKRGQQIDGKMEEEGLRLRKVTKEARRRKQVEDKVSVFSEPVCCGKTASDEDSRALMMLARYTCC